MIVNGKALMDLSPLCDMVGEKRKEFGVSSGLSEAGYDIRLLQDLRFTPPDPIAYMELCAAHGGRPEALHGAANDIRRAFFGYVTTTDPEGNETISEGRFTRASAIEKFVMPERIVAVVHDKSTWAREGVSVFNTVAEPGWSGWLTLEIVFHGNEEIRLEAGSGIAQVLFALLVEGANYRGKYHHQENRPVKARYEK